MNKMEDVAFGEQLARAQEVASITGQNVNQVLNRMQQFGPDIFRDVVAPAPTPVSAAMDTMEAEGAPQARPSQIPPPKAGTGYPYNDQDNPPSKPKQTAKKASQLPKESRTKDDTEAAAINIEPGEPQGDRRGEGARREAAPTQEPSHMQRIGKAAMGALTDPRPYMAIPGAAAFGRAVQPSLAAILAMRQGSNRVGSPAWSWFNQNRAKPMQMQTRAPVAAEQGRYNQFMPNEYGLSP